MDAIHVDLLLAAVTADNEDAVLERTVQRELERVSLEGVLGRCQVPLSQRRWFEQTLRKELHTALMAAVYYHLDADR